MKTVQNSWFKYVYEDEIVCLTLKRLQSGSSSSHSFWLSSIRFMSEFFIGLLKKGGRLDELHDIKCKRHTLLTVKTKKTIDFKAQLPSCSTFKGNLLQSYRILSQRFSAFLFAGLWHFETLRKPELAVLSSPLTGHQNTKADETQSSQAQENNIHGVELWTGRSRPHTWKHSQQDFNLVTICNVTHWIYCKYTKGLQISYVLVTASI